MGHPAEQHTRGGSGGIGLALSVLALVALLLVGVLYVAGLRYRAVGEAEAAALADERAALTAQRAKAAREEAPDPFVDAPEDEGGDPFASRGDGSAKRAAAADAAAESTDPTDPFASLGPAPRTGEGNVGSRLTPAPGELTGSELWQGALEIAERAFRLMTDATGAREQGDEAEAKRLRRQALAQFERALESTATWVDAVVLDFDPRDIQVRSVRSSLARWSKQAKRLRAEL